jgi:membrane fusion protein, multidrug efflux system
MSPHTLMGIRSIAIGGPTPRERGYPKIKKEGIQIMCISAPIQRSPAPARRSAPGARLRTGAGVIGLGFAGLLLAACNNKDEAAKPAPEKTVAAFQPKSATVMRYLYETGTTAAVNRVDLVARVSGALQSIDYQDGTQVKAGQRLFLIEPDQYRAQVAQSEATVEQAQATFDNAQRQLDRQDQLSRSAVTSDTNVDNARATRDTSRAELDAAKASLALAKINLGYTTITAPFDGYVSAHQADVGAYVAASGPTTLATIVQLSPIHVTFSLSDTDMLQIRRQMRESGMTRADAAKVPVEIGTNIDTGYPHRGRLDYASPETASDTGTLAVRAVFDNDDRALLPGLFVRIRIPVGTVKDALLVEPSSIGTDQQGRYVLTVNAEGDVERKSVTLLDRSEGLQQVKGDVHAGDWILRNAASAPRPGERVTKQETTLSAPEGSAPGDSAADAPTQKTPADAGHDNSSSGDK